jgi:feruloyl-CoA synthase
MQLLDPALSVVALPDGSAVVSSRLALDPPAVSTGELLCKAAQAFPNRTLAAERDPAGGWRHLSYRGALEMCRRAGEALLHRGLGPERPLLVMADNSLNHLVLALAAQIAGIPYAPVPSAYALLGTDRTKLRHVIELLTPGLIVIDSVTRFANVLPELARHGEIAATAGEDGAAGITPFRELVGGAATKRVANASEQVGPDTLGKILFTSGSTGMPKAVRHTHGMMTANVEMMVQVWPLLRTEPLVLVDWLPWNHCFGSNNNVNMVLRLAGSLYIDDGKPTAALFCRSLENIGEIAPTFYFNVPAGFAMLVEALERNDALRAHFFSRLQGVFYAGASLNRDVWQRLLTCATQEGRGDLPILSGWGATETGPTATLVMRGTDGLGNIGLPAPGVTLKLAPVAGKFELRVKSPSVTPGYFRDPEATANAFDAEGFYRTGDAGRWADGADVTRGLMYDGRLTDDFKLANGTWVSVGPLRAAILAQCGLVQEIIVCGHDRDYLSLLVWPKDLDGACSVRRTDDHFAGTCAGAAGSAERVMRDISEQVRIYNTSRVGSSVRIARLMIMTEPPSFEAGEITEKGTVNQRVARTRRAALVEGLYADTPSAVVAVIG